MNKLYILMLFAVLFGWRWVSLDKVLPESWTPESKLRFTATVLERPEYTDSKTIIRHGIWYIPLPGYAVIIPGSRVVFVGKVEPKLLMGKVTRIVMMDPTFEVVNHSRSVGAFHSGSVIIALGQLREKWVGVLEKNLPEPMSSLAAGILLGVKGQMPQAFYEQLVRTGTLHIVAASGFNVMIVASVLMMMMQRLFPRGAAIVAGVAGIWLYVLLSGASASVVRAGVMGSLTLMAYYFGRASEARRILWVSAGIMLIFEPLMMVNVGFQLSMAATAGLLYIGPWIERLHSRRKSSDPCVIVGKDPNLRVWIQRFFANYLYPTLSATAATMPVILWHFGRVSLIAPLVNMLILPVVPLIMLLSAFVLLGGQVMAYVAYVPLWYTVWVIRLFGGV